MLPYLTLVKKKNCKYFNSKYFILMYTTMFYMLFLHGIQKLAIIK